MPIVGDCPYVDCSEPLFLSFDEEDTRLPVYGRNVCEGCQRPFWTRYSRYDSWSMPEGEFLEKFDVDHASMRVTDKLSPTSWWKRFTQLFRRRNAIGPWR